MGRHSMDYLPETGDAAGPDTPPTAPVEPPPFAPEPPPFSPEPPDDGSGVITPPNG